MLTDPNQIAMLPQRDITERLRHFVIFKFRRGSTGFNQSRIIGNDNEMDEWCVENVGLQNYSWDRRADSYYGMLIYYFKNEEHATLFKLTWGDACLDNWSSR